jgi:hypothetical protein
MTLEDFKDYFVDESQLIRVYDGETETFVYEGEFADMPDDLLSEEIGSIDSLYPSNKFDGCITVNIWR